MKSNYIDDFVPIENEGMSKSWEVGYVPSINCVLRRCPQKENIRRYTLSFSEKGAILMYDLAKIRRNSEPVVDYLASSGEKYPAFSHRLKEYQLDDDIVEALKEHTEKGVVLGFSAEWCPDCHRNVPVLELVSRATGLEVRVFGHLIRDTLNPRENWRIPPSPPEVKEFNVVKIPLIIVLDKKGEKVGEIVENPPKGMTLEEALLQILKKV